MGSPLVAPIITSLLLLIHGTLGSHSCLLNYTLRPDGLCVRSSHDQYSTCTSFSMYLESFNTQSPPSDCLQLLLEPGVYTLSNTRAATVNYSVVLTSTPPQSAVISCLDVLANLTGEDYFVPLMFGGGTKVSVLLEGIVFDGCNRPLQFDDLESVTISNCSFRCVHT